ncbi:MAG: T9SS type A sorting domain-containing protein, partial [Candidatus Delongbacteria bacterium]|nr:T9SS type A sorting domain-containing protein [Candidatus Delongbacteria bacterium]
DTELHNDGYPFLGWHDTSINNEQLTIDNYELEQNYPNPFNPITTIEFSVQNKAIVYLSVYNSNGQLIKNLVNGVVNAGMHSATFNADNLNSGVYYYQLKIDGAVKETKKMLYIR